MTAVTCKSCGAPLVFAVTVNGRRMPLNPDPHPLGNIRVTDTHTGPEATVLNTDTARAARESGERLFLSHHVTCQFAASYRPRRRPR